MEFYLFHKNFILKLEILENLLLSQVSSLHDSFQAEMKSSINNVTNSTLQNLDEQAVSKLKDSEQAVVVASKQLAETEERVREAIRSLAL